MDKPLPPHYDPYSLRAKPAPRRPGTGNDERKRRKKGSDEQSLDDGFSEKHERIPVTTDARFTSFLNWVFGIAATLVTLGIVWIANVSVSTAGKVDVLVEKTTNIEKRVESIERKR